jgi:hypothetical protein
MKKCRKCNTTKQYCEFNKRKDSVDGLRSD